MYIFVKKIYKLLIYNFNIHNESFEQYFYPNSTAYSYEEYSIFVFSQQFKFYCKKFNLITLINLLAPLNQSMVEAPEGDSLQSFINILLRRS